MNMRQLNNRWFAARLGLVALSFIASPIFLERTLSGEFSEPSWSFPLILTAIVAVGVVFVIALQKINPLASGTLARPSWSTNPFVIRSPLLIFHVGAWCLMSLGVGSLMFGLLSTPRNWAWELPLSAGLGVWLGVRLMSIGANGVEHDDA
jgi:hypothetical protein